MICHGGKFRTIPSFSWFVDRFRWRVSNTNFCISEIRYSYLVLNILLLTCLIVEVVAQSIVDFVMVVQMLVVKVLVAGSCLHATARVMN